MLPMRLLFPILLAAAALATMAIAPAFAADITGAGATFPFPVYAKWARTIGTDLVKKAETAVAARK